MRRCKIELRCVEVENFTEHQRLSQAEPGKHERVTLNEGKSTVTPIALIASLLRVQVASERPICSICCLKPERSARSSRSTSPEALLSRWVWTVATPIAAVTRSYVTRDFALSLP